MVNIPYRSSESLMAERISDRLAVMRRTAGAFVLLYAAVLLLAAALAAAPDGVRILNDSLPLDDPAMAALFTA